ncbi:MAG: hypothetical protein WCD56_17450, partial [Pseudolabrys sp.]
MEQNDKHQRRLEKIIVECREELAPEYGRKSHRQQQGRWHVTALLQSFRSIALSGAQKIGGPSAAKICFCPTPS